MIILFSAPRCMDEMGMFGSDGEDGIENRKPLVTGSRSVGLRIVEKGVVLRAEERFADDREERMHRVQIVVEESVRQLSRRHTVKLDWFGH